MPLGSLGNQSALGPGESYAAVTAPLVVPKRFRGDAYVIVAADIDNGVDEWPNDDNNHAITPIFVNLSPLADLVTSDVVAPDAGRRGGGDRSALHRHEPRCGRNRRGSLAGLDLAHARSRTGRIRDKATSCSRRWNIAGRSAVGAGYDQVVTVQLPDNLESGTWYITPWTDPYDAVLEDTLGHQHQPR